MKKSKIREEKILSFMKEEIRRKGYPPTVREICNALGIKSTSTVHKDISNLVDAGLIKKDPSKPRALMLVEDDVSEMQNADTISDVERTDIIDIPVVGQIAAGTPILAEENITDSFPMPARLVRNSNTFMLTVKGESMIEAGIMDGDYILVEEAVDANNGDMVVALIDDLETEATVKTFYRENGHVRLQPENSSMDPIIVRDVRIIGKVKGVFRYF